MQQLDPWKKLFFKVGSSYASEAAKNTAELGRMHLLKYATISIAIANTGRELFYLHAGKNNLLYPPSGYYKSSSVASCKQTSVLSLF